jgi:hypothetical protein
LRLKVRIWGSKLEFGAQNQYGRAIYSSIGNFPLGKKKLIFGGQKGLETDFGAQLQYGRVMSHLN